MSLKMPFNSFFRFSTNCSRNYSIKNKINTTILKESASAGLKSGLIGMTVSICNFTTVCSVITLIDNYKKTNQN